jgi:hypothetical protein
LAKTALSPNEAKSAAATSVWIVSWEDPDRSWESICLSLPECETEYAARQADHVLQHWGKVGKREPQPLSEWLQGHLRAADASSAHALIQHAKEALRRIAAGEAGPVIVRTW